MTDAAREQAIAHLRARLDDIEVAIDGPRPLERSGSQYCSGWMGGPYNRCMSAVYRLV